MDSSSIVCVADTILARRDGALPRVDTISWYDDSNPTLDERAYFSKVEEKRGRAGFHINLGTKCEIEKSERKLQQHFLAELEVAAFTFTPYSERDLFPELFDSYSRFRIWFPN